MTEMTIYHNPKCSKSRETLRLLTDAGVSPTVVKYLETPPTVAELDRVLTLLNLEPIDIIRRKEQVYQDLAIDPQQMDRQALLQVLVDNPILIERPIVVKGDRAVIGRPPEKVRTFLPDND